MVCFRAHHQRSASHSGVGGPALVRQDRAGRRRQADDFKLNEMKKASRRFQTERNEERKPTMSNQAKWSSATKRNCHPERSLDSRSEAKRSRRTATMAAVR